MAKADTPHAGPRRMILIQSGKYAFAEIDLRRPFQLVGANGLGKTALISALQFLYVDDQSRMKFGKHGRDESRQFYFRAPHSFVLFECDTPLGTVCLGARSLGIAAGYQLERFHWQGPFERSDFIDEKGTPQNWETVRANLALKGLDIIRENAELRRLLGAIDEGTEASWSLVPLVDSRDFKRFQTSFQRLLQLRDLSQDDLKDLLADCAKLSEGQREVDLLKDFRQELEGVQHAHTEIRLITESVELVRRLRSVVADELETRALAHLATRSVAERLRVQAETFQREFDVLTGQNRAADQELAKQKQQQEVLQDDIGSRNQALGRVSDRISHLRRDREEFASFLLDMEAAGLEAVRARVAELRERLRVLPTAGPAEIEERIQLLDTRASDKRRQIENAERLLVTWLRQHLGVEETHRIASLVHPDVLTSLLDEHVDIRKPEAVLARLRELAEASDRRGFETDALRIDFRPGAAREAERAIDPVKAKADLQQILDELKRARVDLETVRNTQALGNELRGLERDETERRKRIDRYHKHQEELEQEEALLEQVQVLTGEILALKRQLEQVEAAKTAANARKVQIIQRMEALVANNKRLESERRTPLVTPGEDPGAIPTAEARFEDLPKDLLDLLLKTRELCRSAKDKAERLTEQAAEFDKRFSGATFSYDPALPLSERLERVEEEIASLEERRASTRNRWEAVLVGARSAFARILESLNQLRKKQRQLNNEFAKMEFSSIASVKLEIVENRVVVEEYRRYANDARQASLFDQIEETAAHLGEFSKLLQNRPKLALNDLFSFRCIVTRRDGVVTPYNDFDQVESTGTTIVLKVVINLLVLRDLLVPGKARIPYYLDEVHALDRQNFGNILHLSERLGFVGIYAAPTTAVGPRRFVHLVPNAKNELVVTPAHVKEILRTPEDTGESGK